MVTGSSVVNHPQWNKDVKDHRSYVRNLSSCEEGPGGGYFPKNWVGVFSTLLETLTLFQTKIIM